jgi:GNAT superfamily N-acetyltransferase
MTAMVVMEMGRFLISTDRSKLDVDVIHKFLARSYWAEGIPRGTVARSIENSLCFGVYDNARQIGFARVISDFATYAYVADVFILEPYRERGLGKELMASIMAHPRHPRCARAIRAVRFQAGRQHAGAHSHGNRGSRDLFAFLNSLRARSI